MKIIVNERIIMKNNKQRKKKNKNCYNNNNKKIKLKERNLVHGRRLKKGRIVSGVRLNPMNALANATHLPPHDVIIITHMVERNNVTMPCHPRPSPADKSHVGCRIAPSIAPRLS